MVGVFAIFALMPILDMKEMGIGLAAAVLIDATIVRAVLLPATMKLLGDWNWYLPKWLEWLPQLEHEPRTQAPTVDLLSPRNALLSAPSFRSPRHQARLRRLQRRTGRPLLLVALDDLGLAQRQPRRILAASRSARRCAQQIQHLIESHLDRLEPVVLARVQAAVRAAVVQVLLLCDELLDACMDLGRRLSCRRSERSMAVLRRHRTPARRGPRTEGSRPDEMRDERTERNDVELLPARIVEHGAGESAAEASAFVRLVHLRVRHRDVAVAAVIGGEADGAAVHPQLVSRLLGNVDDFGVLRRRPEVLHHRARAEVLDEPARRVRLPRVAVVEEAAPVRGLVLPRLEVAQVREDRARSLDEPAVFRPQRRDLVGSGELAQRRPLLRPRLDLASDEVDPELWSGSRGPRR